MATYKATVKFTDIRVITIEADDDEDARRKYDSGEWDGEDTTDFYTESELTPPTRQP